MKKLLPWFDERTGLPGAIAAWFGRPIHGGPAWRFVWPTTIVFAFLIQAITGLAIWMYYSAGAQSSWESVYFLQYHVQLGWLLRAMHHYAAQATLVLIGLYLLEMILRGTYRPPREFLFWTVLLMGLVTLGLNLTGDLLAWDQNSYWATHVRTGFLTLLPGVGSWLLKAAVGGAEFGSLTLTRFLALHIGLFTALLLGLLVLHAWIARRQGLDSVRSTGSSRKTAELPPEGGTTNSVPYWPGQALRDMTACLAVLLVVLALSVRHGTTGPQRGIELGAPADASEDPGTARPEWSFRGLFQFREFFPGKYEILPIFVLSGLTVLVFFAMPLIGRSGLGHRFNQAFFLFVFGSLGVLSWQSYQADARNEKYRYDLAQGDRQADRVKELAAGKGVPAGGALALLRGDALTQGPRLFQQHCASCHPHAGVSAGEVAKDAPTAADLTNYASREWLHGLLDPKQIKGPKYFGNTKFKKGKMADYVTENCDPADKERINQLVAGLSSEAGLQTQVEADAKDKDLIAKGREMIASECTDCHLVHGKGTATGPELTGYGGRDWLRAIISNPAHKRFYGKQNDRMPAYAESATEPAKNILSDKDLGLLVDWLRGEWYEAEAKK